MTSQEDRDVARRQLRVVAADTCLTNSKEQSVDREDGEAVPVGCCTPNVCQEGNHNQDQSLNGESCNYCRCETHFAPVEGVQETTEEEGACDSEGEGAEGLVVRHLWKTNHCDYASKMGDKMHFEEKNFLNLTLCALGTIETYL